MRNFSLLGLLIASACSAPSEPVTEPEPDAAVPAEPGAKTTIVSLTFDDTHADNWQVGAMTEARGMRATFYVNSGRIGKPGYLATGQVRDLQTRGHEIGGHTISHARLTEVTPEEMRAQICADREQLIALGFTVSTFAYPFSAHDDNVRAVVAECGYSAARLVEGLQLRGNMIPPPDPYQIATNESIKATTTLHQLQRYVTDVEQSGGGWVPLVFHHVCDDCSTLGIKPALLAEFLDWLATRPNVRVATVREVMGN